MNIFHCSITKAATLMFNIIFRNNNYYNYFNYNHTHFSQIKNGTIPPNTIVSQITKIKYSNFFKELNITDDYRGFYMARDPREVITSAYYSWLYSHPGGHIEREKIQSLSKDNAMIYIIDKYDLEFDVMYDWLTTCDNNKFVIIRFEEFFENDESQIKNMVNLFKFLKLTQDDKLITKIAKKNTFSHLGGRKAGNINNKHHYRAGIKDTWKTELSDKVLNYLYDKKGENFITDMNYKII